VKHAAGSLAVLVRRAARATGAEGAFLIVGTALLAVGASYVSPAGPWVVVGVVALLIGFALALPTPPTPPRPGSS
jgi:hypothetical protein